MPRCPDLVPAYLATEEVMIVDPSGCMDPITSGPYVVIGCVHLESDFELYAIEDPDTGRRIIVDGMEMMPYGSWITFFRATAN